MTKLISWYITGFCEGGAVFTYSRGGTGKIQNLYFAVKLTEAEEDLIYKLYNFFSVGKIYNVKHRYPHAHGGRTKPALYYRVSKMSELEKIIGHFDKYPLHGLKIKSYKIWKEMFYLKRKHPINHKKLNELAKKLSASSPRNQPWK